MLGRFSVRILGLMCDGECLGSISRDGVKDWFLDEPELLELEDLDFLKLNLFFKDEEDPDSLA